MTANEMICKLDNAAHAAMMTGDHARCIELENDRDELLIASRRNDSEKATEIIMKYGKEVFS